MPRLIRSKAVPIHAPMWPGRTILVIGFENGVKNVVVVDDKLNVVAYPESFDSLGIIANDLLYGKYPNL